MPPPTRRGQHSPRKMSVPQGIGNGTSGQRSGTVRNDHPKASRQPWNRGSTEGSGSGCQSGPSEGREVAPPRPCPCWWALVLGSSLGALWAGREASALPLICCVPPGCPGLSGPHFFTRTASRAREPAVSHPSCAVWAPPAPSAQSMLGLLRLQLSHLRSPGMGPRQERQPPRPGQFSKPNPGQPAWGSPMAAPSHPCHQVTLCLWQHHLQVRFFLLVSDPDGKCPELPLLWALGLPVPAHLLLPPTLPTHSSRRRGNWPRPSSHTLVTPLSLYLSAFSPPTLSHQAETSCRGWCEGGGGGCTGPS